MKTKLFPVALASLSLVALAACGRGDDDDAAAAARDPARRGRCTCNDHPCDDAAARRRAAEFAAKVGESDLGKVMTSANGLTLYGFVNDVNAISTCYSTCADAWPPVIVDEDWAVGPGLDTGVFSTTEREDGSLQLVAGKFPLYTYGGDAAPGDTTGQGSGDVWFAMNLDGTLISDAATESSAPETTIAAASDDPYAQDADAAPETTTPAEESPAADTPAPISIAASDLGDIMVEQRRHHRLCLHQGRGRHADVRGRLRRGLAPGHRRQRRAPRRPRPRAVHGRRAPRRHDCS